MKKNDIVTVITLAGEFVGKFVSNEEAGLSMEDPRMIVQGQDGQMGFARGICQTGVENPTDIVFQQYLFVTNTNEEVQKAYRQATSGIIT
tara:strand:- start:120 stop:389 length:270 start_codon:yes stop_codon:yes gene_type:complete